MLSQFHPRQKWATESVHPTNPSYHSSTSYSNAMDVMTYWVGPKPPLIRVLHRLMHLHSTCPESSHQNYTFQCITQETFLNDKNDTYRAYFVSLPPAFQADIVRVDRIHRDGGLWIDSDTLVMSPLNTLQRILQSNDGFLISERGRKGTKLCNGVFASQAGTPLMAAWKNMIDSYIDRQVQPLHGDLGFRCLSELLYNNQELFSNYIIFDGEKTMYPVAWYESQDIFLSNTTIPTSTIEREFQPLIILLNSVYRNYNGIYTQNGKECALDFYIQKSLSSIITNDAMNTENSIDDIRTFEFNRNKLIAMAEQFIKR